MGVMIGITLVLAMLNTTIEHLGDGEQAAIHKAGKPGIDRRVIDLNKLDHSKCDHH